MDCDSNADENDAFSSIKQWFLDKITRNSIDEGSTAQQDVPKIVVTRGSVRHRSPRPRPLRNTWGNNAEPHRRSSVSSQGNHKKNLNTELHPKERHSAFSKSMPTSPVVEETAERVVRSAPLASITNNIFRFSQRRSDRKKNSREEARSDDAADYHVHVCGTCGQEIKNDYRNRQEFRERETQSFPGSTRASSSDGHEKLHVTYSGSSRGTDCTENEEKNFIAEQCARMVKAASLLEQHTGNSHRQAKQDSLRDDRNHMSLTRSWSINLDRFRIFKQNLVRSNNRDSLRRLAHSNNDVSHFKIEQKDDAAFNSLLEYSPKITRTPIFVNGTLEDDFKKTFQSETLKVPSVYGKIKVMFQLFNERNIFLVTVLDGLNVAPFQSGTLGIYIKVSLMPGKAQKKTSNNRHNSRNPVFYEPFAFRISLDELFDRQLKVKLYNKPGIFSIPEPVGECLIPLYNYDLTAVTVIWQNLKKSKGQKDDLDTFDFSIMERNTPRPRGIFRIVCGSTRRSQSEE